MLSLAMATLAAPVPAAPIIGGSGDFRYQFMPELLQPPAGAKIVDCHGLSVDAEKNIILTYHTDASDPDHCLIRWNPDGTNGVFPSKQNSTLCNGTAHGLKIATEGALRDGTTRATEAGGTQYLYHANNNQKLTKTTLDGAIVWQRNGYFGQDPSLAYRPTWFAVPPDTNYIYLCDGYGSNNVYVFDRRDGQFMNRTFGGKGDRTQHGKFSTNHGCTYDPRNGKIAVSDRANRCLPCLAPPVGAPLLQASLTFSDLL